MSLNDYVTGIQLINEENRMHDSLGHIGEFLRDKDPVTGEPLVCSEGDKVPQHRATVDNIKVLASASANFIISKKQNVEDFIARAPSVEGGLGIFHYNGVQYGSQINDHGNLAAYSLTNASASIDKTALDTVGQYVTNGINGKLTKDVPDVAADILGQYIVTHDLLDAVSYIMKGMNWSTGDDLNWTFEQIKKRAILKCNGTRFFYEQFNKTLHVYGLGVVEPQLLLMTVEVTDLTAFMESIHQAALDVLKDIEDCTSFGDLFTLSDMAIDSKVVKLILYRRRWALGEK